MNYPRRQKYRRASHAGRLALTSLPAATLGLYLVAIGAAVPGGLLLALGVVLGLRTRHWLSLAARSGVGARSEGEVHRALEPLRREALGHSGRGWSAVECWSPDSCVTVAQSSAAIIASAT